MRLLQEEKHNDITILRMLEDRLDAAVSETFKEEIAAVIDGGSTRIVLNLSRVRFMDSSGLGAIISGRKRLGNRGELTLCDIGEMVAKLFKLTRMHKVLRIFGSEEEAMDRLSD